MKKKMIALFLSLALVISILPMGMSVQADNDIVYIAIQYTTDLASENWQVLEGAAPTIQNGEALYLRVTQGELVYSGLAASIDSAQSIGEASIGEITSTVEYVTITGGAVNGLVVVSMTYTASGFEQSAGNFYFTVAGNVVAADAASVYKTAEITQSFADSGAVVFEDVSGELTADDAAKGFALSGTTLSFDTTGKAAGVYDATVGAQLYTVAVMNALSTADAQARSVTMSAYAPDALTTDTEEDGIYTWNGSYNDGLIAYQPSFYEEANGETNPIYLARQVGGALVSMEGYTYSLTCTSMDVTDFVTAETVEIDGVKVVKLSLSSDFVPSADFFAYIHIYDGEGDFVSTVGFYKAPSYSTGDYFFTTYPETVALNGGLAFSGNNAMIYVGEGFASDYSAKVYFTKKSGDPVEYDFLLYDEIDIATLTVESTNNAFIKVKSFIEETPNGENAIGYELEIVDDAQVQFAEIVVSYTDKNGTEHCYYGSVVCVNKTPEAEDATVSTVAEFKAAYNSMESGTIIMEAGTYEMDLVHNKSIAIKAADGATVIINGENDTNEAAIVTIGLSNPGSITGITIDGREQARDGLDPNGNYAYASDIAIQNCDTGIRATASPGSIIASNATFTNNKIAIDASGLIISIYTSVFTDNDVAIRYSADNYNVCAVQLNQFIDNTVDFEVDSTYYNILATQNYFEKSSVSAKPEITITQGQVYYSPYYTNSEMTVLSADIAGAKTNSETGASTTIIEVPVDRTLNSTSVLDNALFAEMKALDGADIEVTIPVTEFTNPDIYELKVTTIWGFNNEEGYLAETLPETMNLEVTDELSATAQSIVDDGSIDKDEIVQYVNFTHEGDLPGTATVKILKTNELSIDDLKLYYINETTGEVEEAEIVEVTEETIDGLVYYVVTVAHCSQYIIGTADIFVSTDNDDSSEEDTGTSGSTSTTTTTTTTTTSSTETDTTVSTQTTETTLAANDLISAVEVQDKFDNATQEQVVIDVEQKSLVSTMAFDILAQNPDKELELTGDGYSWTFKGSDITDPSAISTSYLDTSISFESPNASEIAQLTEGANVINIYFEHHGELPGEATIKLYVGEEHANTTKYLYYYNDTSNALEYLGEKVVNENGILEFTITHCSDYIACDAQIETAAATEQEAQAEESLETDEEEAAVQVQEDTTTSPVGIVIVVVLAALGILIVLLVVKRKGEKED